MWEKVAVLWLLLLFLIREVPASDIDLEARYLD
jgi:hypothetical protein